MKNEHQTELSDEELAMLQLSNSSDAMPLVDEVFLESCRRQRSNL